MNSTRIAIDTYPEQYQIEYAQDRDTAGWYRRVMFPQERKAIREFKEEMGLWGKWKRLKHLKWQAIKMAASICATEDDMDDVNAASRGLLAGCVRRDKKRLRKIYGETKYLVDSMNSKRDDSNRITDEMIEQARVYPIHQLVEVVKNNMAHCIAHDDKNPSMKVFDDGVYCFACGYYADTIGVYMKIRGCNFQDAVRALQ